MKGRSRLWLIPPWRLTFIVGWPSACTGLTQRGQFIPWTALHQQFGQGYNRLRNFRRDFLATLKLVKTQYLLHVLVTIRVE